MTETIAAVDKDGSGAIELQEFQVWWMAQEAEDVGEFSHIVHAFERKRYVMDALHAFYIAVFLLYPQICQTCFTAFRCRHIGDGLDILDSDYSVDCNVSTQAVAYLY